jgi:hypothetical protein
MRWLAGLLSGAALIVLVMGSCGRLNVPGLATADVCNNIEGAQTNIPAGMVADGRGGCVVPSQAAAPAVPAQSQSQQPQAQQPAAAAPAPAQQSAPPPPGKTTASQPWCPQSPADAADKYGGTADLWEYNGEDGTHGRQWTFGSEKNDKLVNLRDPKPGYYHFWKNPAGPNAPLREPIRQAGHATYNCGK